MGVLIYIILFSSPIWVPFITLLTLGLKNRKSNKKLGILLIIISVVYLIVGSGACISFINSMFSPSAYVPASKFKFQAELIFHDGAKYYEYGQRGDRYEINVIDGSDTIKVGELSQAKYMSFSRFNNQLVQYTNNEETQDFEMFIINRENPRRHFKVIHPPLYSDTTNSILITFFKQNLSEDDEQTKEQMDNHPLAFHVLQFTDLLDFDSSELPVDEKLWPDFPKGYTLQIKNNDLIVNNNKQTWKLDIQSQLNKLKE